MSKNYVILQIIPARESEMALYTHTLTEDKTETVQKRVVAWGLICLEGEVAMHVHGLVVDGFGIVPAFAAEDNEFTFVGYRDWR